MPSSFSLRGKSNQDALSMSIKVNKSLNIIIFPYLMLKGTTSQDETSPIPLYYIVLNSMFLLIDHLLCGGNTLVQNICGSKTEK